jgi:hypothetical protein
MLCILAGSKLSSELVINARALCLARLWRSLLIVEFSCTTPKYIIKGIKSGIARSTNSTMALPSSFCRVLKSEVAATGRKLRRGGTLTLGLSLLVSHS